MSFETAHHRIDDRGNSIICSAPEDAHCRRRPQWDTESSWQDRFCDAHSPPHEVIAGQDCWMTEWINAAFLEDCCQGHGPIVGNAPVELTFHGIDIGVTWRLAN